MVVAIAEPTRRRVAKSTSRPVADRQKRSFTLGTRALQRLDVHAAMVGVEPAELVEQLILEHLKRFVIQDRGGFAGVSSTEETSAN